MGNDNYSKVLSENLKAIRRSKGLTTVDLAKILGVSQAKISYIEHCRGVLSGRDIAVLARKLDVPVTEFFRGLDKVEGVSPSQAVAGQLVPYGATLLAKPPITPVKEIPFEEVVSQSIGFTNDVRLNKGFCAALITQAVEREINVDRIFALIGNNPFIVKRLIEKVGDCLEVIDLLQRKKKAISPRAKRQLEYILSVARGLWAYKEPKHQLSRDELEDLAQFVWECLYAKR